MTDRNLILKLLGPLHERQISIQTPSQTYPWDKDGKRRVLFRILSRREKEDLFGLIDRDFGPSNPNPNSKECEGEDCLPCNQMKCNERLRQAGILRTQSCDLISDFLSDPEFFLRGFGLRHQRPKDCVLKAILRARDAARQVGQVRHFTFRHAPETRPGFDQLDLAVFRETNTSTIDQQSLWNHLCAETRDLAPLQPPWDEWRDQISQNRFPYFNDHDFAAMLRTILGEDDDILGHELPENVVTKISRSIHDAEAQFREFLCTELVRQLQNADPDLPQPVLELRNRVIALIPESSK